MVGPTDVVQPPVPRAARARDACLWHVSSVGGARRRGCAAAGAPGFFNRLLLHDVGALAGLDHAEAPRFVLQRAGRGQFRPSVLEALVLRAQLSHLRALSARLAVRLDPAHGWPDVEVEDEREDADERPTAQAIPPDPGTAFHT